jgi:DNA-directed RNA polymerase specialized sigma24 family protein
LAIYTCLDMLRDCRNDKPEGWSHLIANYSCVIRTFLARYYPERAADTQLLSRVWRQLKNPASPLFNPGASTERQFVTQLRQAALAAVERDRAGVASSVTLDLETLTAAFTTLTATERQIVWLETMAYNVDEAARLMNVDLKTVSSVRERAAELLRGNMDTWKTGLLVENGPALGRAAAAASGESCLAPSAFLDTIDGRITWGRKQDYEVHLTSCWHCVDHFCRIREADAALHGATPLSEEELAPFQLFLGIVREKPGLWNRLRGL